MHAWWTETTVLAIPLWNWVVACGVTVAVLFALLWVRGLVRRRMAAQAGSSDRRAGFLLLQVIASTRFFALFVLALLVGLKFLDVPLAWRSGVSQLWFVALVL
ncbi:MAG TPA: mechanosensitive ion channel family protein, partial [Castellaniella sp.]|nr:mechanosensitive ion channel family protein [Castellaniella sp.]